MNGILHGIKSDSPAVTGKVAKQYPWLSDDKHCDVCVIGGGMTGAMCVLSAAEKGLSAVLITSGAAGYGNTGHITGCARFDGGRTLSELDRFMTTEDALRLYSLGFQALDGLQNLCGRLDGAYKQTGVSSGFERRDLLVFTTDPSDLALLEREYAAVGNKGRDCALITRKTAQSSFEFHVSGGILTTEGSAVLNPYALAHLCLMRAAELGAEIFEQTEAIDIQTPKTEDGCVIVRTSTCRTIYADRLIVASGSSGTRILCGRMKKRALFAVIASLPENSPGWSGKCTLGAFGGYSRNVGFFSEGLVKASGIYKNGTVKSLFRSPAEAMRYRELNDCIQTVLPEPDRIQIKYEYSYDFTTASDGLPIAGRHDAYKNCLFALPGSLSDAGEPVYSYIAAEIAGNFLENREPEHGSPFDPMRY